MTTPKNFPKSDKNTQRLMGLSFVVMLITALFSSGYHHFDEHFQILEFAWAKLGLRDASTLTWEYHFQMRPTIQPAIVVALYKVMAIFGNPNPFTLTLITRLISALLACLSILLIYRTHQKSFSRLDTKKWFFLFAFFLWYLFYIGVRFSSENWSGLFFIIGYCSYFLLENKRWHQFLMIGTLLGFSFLFRYQAGFLAVGFMLWLTFIQRESLKNLFVLCFGVLLIVTIGILIDRWFYGEWTITAWHYFEQNVLQDKVSSFGTQPWWWYLEAFFLQGVPPISLILLLAFVPLALKWKHPILWTVLPFLFIHFVIGHKELRFLFPMVYFLPIVLAEGLEWINERYSPTSRFKKIISGVLGFSFATNLLLLVFVAIKPADANVPLYRVVYEDYTEPISLFWLDRNPYYRVADIYFYKPDNLSIHQVQQLEELPKDTNFLLVTKQAMNASDISSGFTLVYSKYPQWTQRFNFNDWQSRSQPLHLYHYSAE